MAESNFKVFAEATTDILTDVEYESDSQRANGVMPGVAKSALHNKLYRQTSMVAAALAQVLAERGHTALDSDYQGLIAAIRQAFAGSINNIKPNAQGDIEYKLLKFDDIYPVGSIYISATDANPTELFGGTWVEIAGGRCLIGEAQGYALGTTGGESTHTLTEAELAPHTHIVSVKRAGGHKHNRGTMNITGEFGCDDKATRVASGAFQGKRQNDADTSANGGDSTWYKFVFNAADAWTGETSDSGEHTHDIIVAKTGAGQAHNNMPPYLVVRFWQRTA